MHRREWVGARYWLWTLAAAAWGIGLYLRWDYLFVSHPPTRYLFSDMQGYQQAAVNLFDPLYQQTIADSLYPPGNAYYLGFLHWLDPSWGLALAAACGLSALVPLLCGLVAFDLFGMRTALASVVLASLYWPFVDYAGYFLAEGPLIFALVLAMALLVRALRVTGLLGAVGLGLLAGFALGLAATLKTVALLSGAIVAGALLLAALRHRWRRVPWVAVAVAVGLIPVLVPTAVRCTRLQEGHFCLIGRESGLNMFLGHQGQLGSAKFFDHKRGIAHEFGCPVAAQKGYMSRLSIEYGAYESEQLAALAWQWTVDHPVDSLLLSIEHVFDNFVGSVPWPSSAQAQRRWALLFQEAYYVLLLTPALLFLHVRRREIVRLAAGGIAPLLLALPLLGLVAASFVAKGEPRYRIPFDTFTLILAAALYTRGGDRADPFRLVAPRAADEVPQLSRSR